MEGIFQDIPDLRDDHLPATVLVLVPGVLDLGKRNTFGIHLELSACRRVPDPRAVFARGRDSMIIE